jgi:hypothetical protein
VLQAVWSRFERSREKEVRERTSRFDVDVAVGNEVDVVV